MATGGTVCRFYGTAGGCWYGDRCRFIHDLGEEEAYVPQQRRQMPRCRYYRTQVGCRYGSFCEFRHDNEATIQQIQQADDLLASEFENLSLAGAKQKPKSEIGQVDYPDNRGDHYYTAGDDEDDDDEEEEEEEENGDDYGSDHGHSFDEDENKWKTWKDAKKERTKPDVQEAICGECEAEFEGEDAFDQLKDHYMDQLITFNQRHLKFLSSHHRFDSPTSCIICDDKLFMRSRDLLRHMTDKIKNGKDDAADHHLLIEVGIALPFCYRDTVDHDQDKLNMDLFLALVNTYTGLDSDDSDANEFMDFMRLMTVMQKNPGLQKIWQDHDDDDDDDDDDLGNFGFTADECDELAMQGIRPWDPEAHDALGVIYGDDEDYY